MKRITGLWIALIPLLLPACKKPIPDVAHLTPMEAVGMLRNDFAVLVDAREEPRVIEVAEGAFVVPASKLGPGDPAWNQVAERAGKDKQIIVYAENTAAAETVARKISGMGLRSGTLGTLEDWKKAGLPARKREPARGQPGPSAP
jgi:rhodanese-related sulfurtransferase